MSGMVRRSIVMVLVAGLLGAGLVAGGAAPAAAASCRDPFTAAWRADLARRYPTVRVTASVYDTASGCWYHLNPGLSLTTASVVKAQVLGAVLLKAQREGRSLTAWERERITPMISYSYNGATSQLYQHVGSVAGMRASDAAFGASATTHTATFGLTRSTAVDRTRVALRLLWGGGGLGQAGRDEVWAAMTAVHPLQRWGITAGVPAGWTVALKNGFYPASGLGWRVGSSGFVRRDDADQGYAITVMTEKAPNQATGIAITEDVSRQVAATITVGRPDQRDVDRRTCVTARAGESWTALAGRLGLPASRAAEVRQIGGGEAAALSGQQVCSPVLRPEPTAGSVQGGRFVPVASDLNGDGADDLLWYGPGAGVDEVWWSELGGHRRAPIDLGGDLIPLAGDFDGDGNGDVFWYGPGTRPDRITVGGPDGPTDVPISVSGTGYHPAVGDFDGDGFDDIFWYTPGAGADSVWYSTGTRGGFVSMPVSVFGTYEPVVVDTTGDGADDIYWYAPGPVMDGFWPSVPGVRGFTPVPAVQVDGRFDPLVGDLDGDGLDEIVWYAAGAAPDVRWESVTAPVQSTPMSINGTYAPLVGDVDGDGIDDLIWYGHGGLPDSWWRGGATGLVPVPFTVR